MLTLILSFAKCLFTFLVTFFKYILLFWGVGGQSPGSLIWSTQCNAGVFWSVLFVRYLYKSVIWILAHDLKFNSTSVVCVYVVSSWENTNIRNATLRIVLLLFNTSSGTLFIFIPILLMVWLWSEGFFSWAYPDKECLGKWQQKSSDISVVLHPLATSVPLM